MSILSFRDLLDIPGKDYAVPENNPISDGISKFCEAFKEVHQEDFEQFGKDVLLEGLKSNQYSMTFDSDPFRLYLLQKDKVFRTDLGKKGLRLTYNFLKSYGRLPFPEERLDKPDTVVLFKEKLRFLLAYFSRFQEPLRQKKFLSQSIRSTKRFLQVHKYFIWTTDTVPILTFRIRATGSLMSRSKTFRRAFCQN